MELLDDVLEEVEEVFVDEIVLCLLETLLVLDVEACELVVGELLLVAIKTRNTVTRGDCSLMIGDSAKDADGADWC